MTGRSIRRGSRCGNEALETGRTSGIEDRCSLRGGNMLRVILLVTVVITSAASVAGAQQPLHIKPLPLDLTLVGVCSFDVHYSEVRVHGNDLVFVGPQGDV